MSQQAVLAFREKVKMSRDLQKQVRAGAQAKNLDIVALGNAHGCDFTAEEARAFLNEAELSDFELQMVSGGAGKPGPSVTASDWRRHGASSLTATSP